MLMVRFYIKNIDYDTFVDKLMPFIEKWLLEKDNIFADAVKNISKEVDQLPFPEH